MTHMRKRLTGCTAFWKGFRPSPPRRGSVPERAPNASPGPPPPFSSTHAENALEVVLKQFIPANPKPIQPLKRLNHRLARAWRQQTTHLKIHGPEIEELSPDYHLTACTLTGTVTKELLETLFNKQPQITSLTLSPQRMLQDDALAKLGQTGHTLRKLDLTACRGLKDAQLSFLSSLSGLKELNLAICHSITDKGLSHLQSPSQLSLLNLTECTKITDTGLKHLTVLTELRTLILHGCDQFSKQGIASLQALPNLTQLNLTACAQVNDDYLSVFHGGFSNLRELNLSVCHGVTPNGLAKLRGTRPQLTVHRDGGSKAADLALT